MDSNDICVPDQCTCDAVKSYADVKIAASGPACWQNGRHGCMKKCNSEDCDVTSPFFMDTAKDKQCQGVGVGILGAGCCVPSECCAPTTEKMWVEPGAGPIFVDFYVFSHSRGTKPLSSGNIGGADGCGGFCRRCDKSGNQCNGDFPYNREVAELNIVDLNNDFAELVPPGQKGPTFAMGDYKEVTGDTAIGTIDSLVELSEVTDGGHALLKKLSYDNKVGDVLYPRPGRISVWIPTTAILADQSCYGSGSEKKCYQMYLLGSTYLGMSANPALAKGPGVLLAGEVQRRGRRLSHEIGHIVGFDHAYWQDMTPCDINIMGSASGTCDLPTPRFTFTAGKTNSVRYPKIFANWRHDTLGKPPEERPHLEMTLAQATAEKVEDAFLNCKEIIDTHGKDVLDAIQKEKHLQCKDATHE